MYNKINRSYEKTSTGPLSLKDIKDDPWYEVTKNLILKILSKAKLNGLRTLELFIRLDGGITGMLPVSVMKRAEGESYRKRFSPPQEVEVKIVNLDVELKKFCSRCRTLKKIVLIKVIILPIKRHKMTVRLSLLLKQKKTHRLVSGILGLYYKRSLTRITYSFSAFLNSRSGQSLDKIYNFSARLLYAV